MCFVKKALMEILSYNRGWMIRQNEISWQTSGYSRGISATPTTHPIYFDTLVYVIFLFVRQPIPLDTMNLNI